MAEKRRLFLPVTAAVLLVLFALTALFSGAEVSGEDSREQEGFFALEKLLEKMGFIPGGIRYQARESEAIYLVQEGSLFTEDEWNRLVDWMEHNEALVIFSGKPRDFGPFEDWEGVTGEGKLVFSEPGQSEGLDHRSDSYTLLPPKESWTSLLGLEKENALILQRKVGLGKVMLVADKGFLTNRRILENDHALLWARILAPYSGRRIFYLKNIETRPYLGMQVFLKGSAGRVSLQVLLLALAAGWYFALRVGGPDRLGSDHRRELREHLVAVGRLYSRAGYWRLLDRIEKQFYIHRLEGLLTHLDRENPADSLKSFITKEEAERSLTESESLKELMESSRHREKILKTVNKRIKGAQNGNG